jgi:hypothetical protein
VKLKSLLFATGFGILAISFNASCTKITPTDIGTDLLPVVDNVTTFDTTLRVYADNYLFSDSSRVNYVQNHALGIIADDPEFGKTESQIYLSVVPAAASRNPFTSIDSIVGMDSVILGLAYAGIYGDSTSVQKINVYEISDTAFKDTLGYIVQHPEFNTLPTVIGNATVNFTTLNDPRTIVVKKDTTVIENQMRIPLDPALGLRFAAYDTGSVYLSSKRDSAFHKVFNGLAIRIDEGASAVKNALAYFDLSNANTKLTFYFRVKNNGKIDTVSTDFTLYLTSAYTAYNANIIKRTPMHGYGNLNVATGIADADKLYIQSSPGSYAILKVPGLTGLGNRIVHRAEIAFKPLDLATNDVYTSPDFLFLDLVDSTNNRFLTIGDDFVYSFSNYTYDYQTFGGYLKDGRYFFNVTRYVQKIATTQSKNYPFRLSAPKSLIDYYVYPKESGSVINEFPSGFGINSKIAKGRAFIGGGSNSAQPMTLRIIYSKI